MKRNSVIFITTSFGSGSTGPEIYTRYLWDSFLNDCEFDFHVVAPSIMESHPRLHSVETTGGSLDLYRRVAQEGLKLAKALDSESNVLIHVNTSNLHQCLLNSKYPVWGQINDYENTLVFRNAKTILKKYGFRRFLALWRRRFLEKRFVSFQSKTLCNSHYTRARILECYAPSQPDRLVVLHKAVDVASFRKPAQLPPDLLRGSAWLPHCLCRVGFYPQRVGCFGGSDVQHGQRLSPGGCGGHPRAVCRCFSCP